MRLPLVAELDSRDGVSNKDARLANTLIGEKANGVQIAGLRPGLSTIASATGNSGGATAFNGTLITVFGTVIGYGEGPTSIGAVIADTYDFVASPL